MDTDLLTYTSTQTLFNMFMCTHYLQKMTLMTCKHSNVTPPSEDSMALIIYV